MRVATWLVAVSAVAAAAAQTPPRDAPATVANGTASIRGVVITETADRSPIRHARVALAGVPGGRVAITDDAGHFVFAALPSGTYAVTATKPAYLAAAYGAVKPGRAGTSIVLADSQTVDVSIGMWLGGVIAGVIRDTRGRPVSNVDVGLIPLPTLDAPRPSFSFAPAHTDDRGEYRLFGVPPGSFYVAAVVQNSMSGAASGRRSVEENDALFALLQVRVAGGAAIVPGATPKKWEPLPIGPTVGFAPVLYPGTTRIESATIVTITAGAERLGVDFVVAPVRSGSVDGTVQGPVQNLDRVELSLMIDGPEFPAFSSSRPILTQSPNKEGHFHYDNMPPGRYSILARALAGDGDPTAQTQFSGVLSGVNVGGGRSGGSSASQEGQDYVYARADVEVDAAGVSGVAMTLMPGVTATGKVAFDRTVAAIPADLTQIRFRVLATQPIGMSVSNNTAIGSHFLGMPLTPLRGDGTWIVRGVPPATFNLVATLPAAIAEDWWLRSAMLGGRDLLDGSFEVSAGQDLSGIVFTLSDRHSELSGTLTTGAGRPASDYFIIVCPTDPKLWTPGSRRVKSLRPSSDGSFGVKDLPAGEYVIAALTDVAPGEWNDPQWLAGVAPAGLKITIGDGAKTVQNLKVGGT